MINKIIQFVNKNEIIYKVNRFNKCNCLSNYLFQIEFVLCKK